MSAKKRVLVFIDWYLPGYKAGGPIQSCANLVHHLADQFDFFIVTRNTDYCETAAYTGIKSDEWNVIDANGTQVYYFSDANLNFKSIKKICQDTAFDFAYINGVYSYYFSILPLYFLKGNSTKKIIVAARGMLAQSAIQVKKTKKNIFLVLAKSLGLFKKVTFQASTAAEVKDIEKAIGKDTLIVEAGNLPRKITQLIFEAKKKSSGKLRLVNVARIAPEKNLKFALQILKEVKAEIEFDFFGPIYNESYFKECAQLIEQMPSNIKVNYRNSLKSEEVAATILTYHALLMPTLGENFGHIILESFVGGCPVIISDQTPWINLEQRKLGFDIGLDEKMKFVEAIEFLAQLNQNEFTTWSKAAFDFGAEYLNSTEIIKQNLTLFSH